MKQLTISAALNEGLREEMVRDDSVVLIGEDIAAYGGTFDVTKGLLEEFGPQRVYGAPISEGAIVGACVGAALAGMRPVGEIMFIDFLACAMDQMANYVSTLTYAFGGQASLPLVIRTTTGTHGGAQHSKALEAWLTHLPGLKVAMPCTAGDAKGLLKSAIRDNNPVVLIENRHLYQQLEWPVSDGEVLVPLGKAEVKREGGDVTIIATGRTVHYALQAAEQLEADAIEAEVVDPRTLVPLDLETLIESVAKTRRVMVVHDAWRSFGVGAEIAARLYENLFDRLAAPIERVAQEDVHTPYSITLGRELKPNADKIAAAARRLLADRHATTEIPA